MRWLIERFEEFTRAPWMEEIPNWVWYVVGLIWLAIAFVHIAGI